MKTFNSKFNLVAMLFAIAMFFATSINVTAQIRTTKPVKTDKTVIKTVKPIGTNSTLMRKPLGSTMEQQTNTTTDGATDTIVYAAGYIDGHGGVLWVNNDPYPVRKDNQTFFAYSVFVSDNNVYTVFTEDYVPFISRNGNISELSHIQGKIYYPTSVFVVNNVIYVLGQEKNPSDNFENKIVLWKNGVKQYITDGKNPGCPTSLFVSGDKIYITGFESPVNNPSQKQYKLWMPDNEPTYNFPEDFRANSICVSNGNIYVAGEQGIQVAVWKNNNVTIVPNTTNCRAYAISVFGDDVYLAGTALNLQTTKFFIRVWKNGVPTDYSDGLHEAFATSMFVAGDDVYVSGYEWNDNIKMVAKIWKNGVATSLSDGTSNAEANCVFVQKINKIIPQ